MMLLLSKGMLLIEIYTKLKVPSKAELVHKCESFPRLNHYDRYKYDTIESIKDQIL